MYYLVTIGYETEQMDREGNPRIKKVKYVLQAESVEEATIVAGKYRSGDIRGSESLSVVKMPIECVIDENESQFKSNPEKSDKIRFGWLGGSSHLYDLELIKSGISSTLSSYKDKTQFVLCGFDLRGNVNEVNQQTGEVKQRPIKPMETVWYQYEKMFTDDYKILSEEYKNYLLSFKEDDYNDVNEP